jgi:hypothetical protein
MRQSAPVGPLTATGDITGRSHWRVLGLVTVHSSTSIVTSSAGGRGLAFCRAEADEGRADENEKQANPP